jgi:hypothetical protein
MRPSSSYLTGTLLALQWFRGSATEFAETARSAVFVLALVVALPFNLELLSTYLAAMSER